MNQDDDTAAVVIGEGVGLIDDTPDAQAIIQRTVEQAALLLGHTAQHVLARQGEDLG